MSYYVLSRMHVIQECALFWADFFTRGSSAKFSGSYREAYMYVCMYKIPSVLITRLVYMCSLVM